MKTGRILAVSLILAAAPLKLCHAVELEVTPLVGDTFGGSFEESYSGTDLDLDEGVSLGAALDFPLGQGRQVEIYYSRQPTELRASDPGPGFPSGSAAGHGRSSPSASDCGSKGEGSPP